MSSSSDDDLPPLEDMSKHFNKPLPIKKGGLLDGNDRTEISNIAATIDTNKNTTNKEQVNEQINSSSKANSQPKPKPQNGKPQNGNTFGGFSKGFLSGPPKAKSRPKLVKPKLAQAKLVSGKNKISEKENQKPSSDSKLSELKPQKENCDLDTLNNKNNKNNTCQPETEEIICPKNPNQNSLKFDQVTKNMATMIDNSKNDWLNDDLLNRVESDQTLIKSLNDPEVSKALDWMQKDPAAAFEYYKKNDPSKLDLFKNFTKLLGNHMTSLETKKESDSKRIQEKNDILEKPKIKELVHYLKTNPERANHLIHSNKDEQFKEDVRVLLASGDLKFDGIK